ncbi:MAG: hypothetical protein ACI4QT_04385 [Kiritimatiellia bacterium]
MKTIIPIVRKCLRSHPDVSGLSESMDAYGNYFEFDSGVKTLDDRCLFDGLSKSDKVILLRFLFARENMRLDLGWQVNVELAKLAAKDGNLVREEAEAFLNPDTLREHWIDCVLRVGYWGSSIDYEAELVDLILEKSNACGDGYDGLFVATWFMHSTRVDEVLAKVVTEWFAGGKFDSAACALSDIGRLLDRWDRMDGFTAHLRLRELYRLWMAK